MKKGEGMADRFRQPEWKKQRQEAALREKFEKALPSPKPQRASGWKWPALLAVALIAWATWKALKLA